MRRYIKDIFTGEYHWTDDDGGVVMRFGKPRETRNLYVIKDIEPYQSVIDGSIITGRRQHRDHLRAHEVIEVGNEKPKPPRRPELPPVASDIKAAIEMVRGGYRPPPVGRE